MAFDTVYNGSNPVSVGDPTRKSDYDQVFDNTVKHEITMAAFRMSWVRGMQVRVTGASNARAEIGSIMDTTGLWEITFSSAALLDFTTTGEGGLDTGSKSADSRYNVYAILNSSTGAVGIVASLQEVYSSITDPSGFDKGRWIGFVGTDASGNIELMQTTGDGIDRWVMTEQSDFEGSEPFQIQSGTIGSTANQTASLGSASPLNDAAGRERLIGMDLGWKHDDTDAGGAGSDFRILFWGAAGGSNANHHLLETFNDNTGPENGGNFSVRCNMYNSTATLAYQASAVGASRSFTIYITSVCITLRSAV